MRYEPGQRVEVEGREGKVVDHSAKEPHLVVVRFDNGDLHKVLMGRVRVIGDKP